MAATSEILENFPAERQKLISLNVPRHPETENETGNQTTNDQTNNNNNIDQANSSHGQVFSGTQSSDGIPALPPLIRIDSIRKQSAEPEKIVPESQSQVLDFSAGSEFVGEVSWMEDGGEVPSSDPASDEEINKAVLQVVQVFSKPEPDRQRLFKAVLSAVKGETTIKEAATQYYFATSTMHPYVHRARELLGSRAPPMKSSRTGMILNSRGRFHSRPKETPKIPLHLQHLKPLSTNVSEFLKNSFPGQSFASPDTIRLKMQTADYDDGGNSEFALNAHLPIESLPVESLSPAGSFDGGELLTENSVTEEFNNGERRSSGGNDSSVLTENEEELGVKNTERLQESRNSSFLRDSSINDGEFEQEDSFQQGEESRRSSENEIGRLSVGKNLDKADGVTGQAETPEDAAREVIQNSEIPEAQSMGLFLNLVRCLNGEMHPRDAALSLDIPTATVSSLMEKAKRMLPAEEIHHPPDPALEKIVDKSIRGSHYYGASKERLHLAVIQTIRGDLPLTQAAAKHDIPFSTLHPYVKRAKVLMNNPIVNGSKESPGDFPSFFGALEGSPTMVGKDFKRSSIPGIVASGAPSTSLNAKITSIALSSNFGPGPKAPGAKHPTKIQRGKFQDGMPELAKLPPEVVKLAVERAVQSCQYDSPQKKERLCNAVLVALSGSKTMKAAAAMHEVPFTTLQTYFHRSKAQIQRASANIKAGETGDGIFAATPPPPPANPAGNSSPDLRPALNRSCSNDGNSRLSPESGETSGASRRTPEIAGKSESSENSRNSNNARARPPKRPWSCAESLWSKLKERQDKAQQEMNIQVGQVLSSRNSSVNRSPLPSGVEMNKVKEEDTNKLNGEDNELENESAKPSPILHEDVKMNFDKSLAGAISVNCLAENEESGAEERISSVVRSEETGGASRRKPKKVVRNSEALISPTPGGSCASNSSTPAPQDSTDLNSAYLQGDDDKFFGAPQAEAVNDLLSQFWQTMEGAVDIVQPMAPEDMDRSEDGDSVGRESSLGGTPRQKSTRNYADIRKQDEEKLTELLKSVDSHVEINLSITEAVERATENSQYDGEQRERLKEAALMAVSGNCSMKEAARAYDIPLGTLHTYFHRAKNLIQASKAGLDPNNPDVVALVNRLGAAGVQIGAKKPKKKEKSLAMQKWEKEIETMEELQGLDNGSGEITHDKLIKVVERVIRNSLYPPEQKERLLNAVSRVISGELTINAAANIYHLPSSTVHPYVHRARAALGKLCPPQAKLTPIAKVAKSPKLQETLAKLHQHFQNNSATKNAANRAKQNAMVTMRNSAISKSLSSANAQTLLKAGTNQQEAIVDSEPPMDQSENSWPESRRSSEDSEQFSNGVNFEDADRVVTELVKTSLYGDEGRQRLYEAILMVITDSANVSEAARTYQIPPSTIQPYVARARVALNLPGASTNPVLGAVRTSSPAASSMQKSTPKSRTTIPAPKVFAAPGHQASDDEVRKVVERVVKNSVNADDRRERLYQAVFEAVSGKATIKDACTKGNLPASTVHPYVSRARHMLGDRCPQPKIATIVGSPAHNFYKGTTVYTVPNASLTPPQSVDQSRVIAPGNNSSSLSINDEKKLPALIVLKDALEKEKAGRKMLELQLKQILSRYNYRGDRDRLVYAIATVIGEKKTLLNVSELTGIAQTTLSTYVRIARMFVKESGYNVEELDSDLSALKALPSEDSMSENQNILESPLASSSLLNVKEESSIKPVLKEELKEEPKPDLSVETAQDVKWRPAFSLTSPSSANKRKSLPNAIAELVKLGAPMEDTKEKKIKAAIQYTVSVQYKQNQQAKKQLMDAIEDVMLHEIDIQTAIGENQGVITQFVIEKFIDRVEKGVVIMENGLTELYSMAASWPEDQDLNNSGESGSPPSKRAKKVIESLQEKEVATMSPTRISRRLQEKQKAEVEAEGKFSPDLEAELVEFLKKLDTINFPTTSEMVLTIANEMLKEQKKGTEEKLGNAWIERLKQKYASVLSIGR